MIRAIIERTDPLQRRDGTCHYELWELDQRGFKGTLRGRVPVPFRLGNPDSAASLQAKTQLRGIAETAGLQVVREMA